MSDTIYTYDRTYTTKDGTKKTYKTTKKYTKSKPADNIKPIVEQLKLIKDPVKLERIAEFIRDIDGKEAADQVDD